MDDVFTILYLLFISYLHNYTIFFVKETKIENTMNVFHMEKINFWLHS